MVYDQSRLDATFGALADPTRREILSRLALGEQGIAELAGRFSMSLPAVSKHVRVLERAGLAFIRKEGRTRRTALVAAPMREAQAWIETYRQFWEFQFDQLAAYLDAGADSKEKSWPHRRKQSRAKRSKSGARSTPRGSASSTRGRRRKK
jgi:DNA-binding transcriptional ArsR family regulator